MRILHYVSAVLLFIVGGLLLFGCSAWIAQEFYWQALLAGFLSVVGIMAGMCEWAAEKRLRQSERISRSAWLDD